MNFTGIIIGESLADPSVLATVTVVSTKVEPVTEDHQTPWLKQWTLLDVAVSADQADAVAELISHALDSDHAWYADFHSDTEHYIIYHGMVFHVTDRTDLVQYDRAIAYGLSLGIPQYQLDFVPHETVWKR